LPTRRISSANRRWCCHEAVRKALELVLVDRHVLDHRGAEDDVELVVGERQRAALVQQRGLEAEALSPTLQRRRVDVGDRDVVAERDDRGDVIALLGAEVEDPVAIGRLEHRAEDLAAVEPPTLRPP